MPPFCSSVVYWNRCWTKTEDAGNIDFKLNEGGKPGGRLVRSDWPHVDTCTGRGKEHSSLRPWSPHWCACEWLPTQQIYPSSCLSEARGRRFISCPAISVFRHLFGRGSDSPRLYQTSISPLRVRTSMMVWPRKSSLSRLNLCLTRDLMSSSSSHTRTLIRSDELWHSLGEAEMKQMTLFFYAIRLSTILHNNSIFLEVISFVTHKWKLSSQTGLRLP